MKVHATGGICRLVLGLVILNVSDLRAAAVEPPAPAAKVEGAPRIEKASYRFFDAATGAPTGRLQIASIDMEYRRQGFMRVAWRPLVVLQSVKLDIGENMIWPDQGSQIVQALQALGGKDELILRDVVIQLGGTRPREILAASATLTVEGELELRDARITTQGDQATPTRTGTFRLSFSGSHAGQLRTLNARTGTNTRPLISNNVNSSLLTQ